MIEPAGKNDEQAALGLDSHVFSIRITWCRHCLHTGARVEELQNATERAVWTPRPGIDVVDARPCAVGMRMRRMIGARAANRRPRGNGYGALRRSLSRGGINHAAHRPGYPTCQ